MSNQSDWQILYEIKAGIYRNGFVVRNSAGELRTLITLDKDRFLSFGDECVFEAHNKVAAKFSERIDLLLNKFAGHNIPGLPHIYSLQANEKGDPMVEYELLPETPIRDELCGSEIDVFMAHFKELFEAVSYMHEKGFLMLDWDPRYIFTNLRAGYSKICNLWSVRKKEAKPTDWSDFNWYYAAPEVLLGHTPDERSDLYSLAVIMYETWCGLTEPVFKGYRTYSASLGLEHIQLMDMKGDPEKWPADLGFELNDETEIKPTKPKKIDRIAAQKTLEFEISKEPEEFYEMKIFDKLTTEAPYELKDGLVYRLLKKTPENRFFESAEQVIHYIEEKWPITKKPASQIYAGTTTTVKILG